MDLGLEELTDDQLLDLLQQACLELARRDGYVRQLAQRTIVTAAEKMKALREVAEPLVLQIKREYIAQLKQEVESEMREALQSGVIRLNMAEETAAVVAAVQEAHAAFLRTEMKPPNERAGAARRTQEAAERYKRMTRIDRD